MVTPKRRVELYVRHVYLAACTMCTGDHNGGMSLLCGSVEQAVRTTRFISGVRMHRYQGRSLTRHGPLVCRPPQGVTALVTDSPVCEDEDNPGRFLACEA